MLKKSLIGVVLFSVLAIAVMPVSAGNIKAHSWPLEFKTKPFDFKIPVKLDVALFIEIINQKDLKNKGIKLDQKSASKYEGCTDVKVKCNVPVKIGASAELTDAGSKLGAAIDKVWVENGDITTPTLSGGEHVAKVCIKLKNVKPYELEPKKNVHVADITLTAKPTLEVEWTDP